MPTRRGFYVEARSGSFVGAVSQVLKALDPSVPEKPGDVYLGATYRASRELRTLLANPALRIDPASARAVEEAFERLEEAVGTHRETVRGAISREIPRLLERLTSEVHHLQESEPEEVGEMLLGRSALYELELLAQRFGVSMAGYAEKIAEVDRKLRDGAGVISRIGTPVVSFWIDHMPIEYWWWRFVKEPSAASSQKSARED